MGQHVDRAPVALCAASISLKPASPMARFNDVLFANLVGPRERRSAAFGGRQGSDDGAHVVERMLQIDRRRTARYQRAIGLFEHRVVARPRQRDGETIGSGCAN
jgi:hypothetical protein